MGEIVKGAIPILRLYREPNQLTYDLREQLIQLTQNIDDPAWPYSLITPSREIWYLGNKAGLTGRQMSVALVVSLELSHSAGAIVLQLNDGTYKYHVHEVLERLAPIIKEIRSDLEHTSKGIPRALIHIGDLLVVTH